MFDLKKHFEKLMNTPCEIHRAAETQASDGTVQETLTCVARTRCSYFSKDLNLAEIEDKEKIAGTYIFCLPVGSDLNINDYIKIDDKYYKVTEKQEPERFELICRGVFYENRST